MTELEKLVAEGESTYSIAKILNISQTNVRFKLRKLGINTLGGHDAEVLSTCLNGLSCKSCSSSLTGKQKLFCSNKCKISYHYHSNSGPMNANTNERQKRIAKERKLKLIEMSGGKCQSCGYNKNWAALQFHHRNPENKTFSLDGRKLSNTNWKSIEMEWQKCDLLCANCHAETHYPDHKL